MEQLSCTPTGLEWVGRLLPRLSVNIVAFHGSRLVVKDVMKDRVLGELECGGGHRSWDIRSTDTVVYIKDRKVFQQSLHRQGDVEPFLGTHTQQINTLVSLRYTSSATVTLSFMEV